MGFASLYIHLTSRSPIGSGLMNKSFSIGFVIGLLLFFAINLLAAHRALDCGLATFSPSSSCADTIARLGWPLLFYESGGFIYRRSFDSLYFFIDFALGIALAFAMGWLFSQGKKSLPK